jgi:hypothetical protein
MLVSVTCWCPYRDKASRREYGACASTNDDRRAAELILDVIEKAVRFVIHKRGMCCCMWCFYSDIILVDYQQSSCTATPAKDNKMASHTSTTQHPFAVIVPIIPSTASSRHFVLLVDDQKSSCTSTPVNLKDNKMASHRSTTHNPVAVLVPITSSKALSPLLEQQNKVIRSPSVRFKFDDECNGFRSVHVGNPSGQARSEIVRGGAPIHESLNDMDAVTDITNDCAKQDEYNDKKEIQVDAVEADPGTGNPCEEKVDDQDDAANLNEGDAESCMSMRWTTGKHNVICDEDAETYAAVLTSTEYDGSTAPPATGDAENASQNIVRAEVTDFDSLETPFLEVCMHPLACISLFFSFVTCCR